MLIAGGPASRLSVPDALARTLLDASPAASCIVDRAGHLVHVNAAWRALAARTATFGGLGTLVTPEDLDGSPYVRRLASLAGPLAPAAHKLARAIEEALAGHASERIPYRVHRPEGEVGFEAMAVPLPDPARLALVQHLDLAEHERAAEAHAAAIELGLALEEARAEQRRAARRLQAAGQDLHTPITPIRLQARLLRNGDLGPLTPRQAHALDVIERNAERWAQGEGSLPQVAARGWRPVAPADLAQLAAAAVEERRAHALRQGVRLSAPALSAPLPVLVSPDLVGDLLDVLLGRAIAATPAGGTVAVELAARDGEAIVEVRDGGAGLSAREVRDLFEPWGGRRPGRNAASPFLFPYLRWAVAATGRAFAESDGPGNGLLVGLAFPLRGPDVPAAAPAKPAAVAKPARRAPAKAHRAAAALA